MGASARPRYLLDTDVVIWQLRGHRGTVELLGDLAVDGLACSTLTIYEVWRGVREHERADTRRILDALDNASVTPDIAYQGAEYVRAHRSQGVTLQEIDSLIAATARIEDCTLLTYNRRHFPMDDILLFDPMPPLD